MAARTQHIETNFERIATREPFAVNGIRALADELADTGKYGLEALWSELIRIADERGIGWGLPGQNGFDRGGDKNGNKRGTGKAGSTGGVKVTLPVSVIVAQAVTRLSTAKTHVTATVGTGENGEPSGFLSWTNGETFRSDVVAMVRKARAMPGTLNRSQADALYSEVLVPSWPDTFAPLPTASEPAAPESEPDSAAKAGSKAGSK